MEVLPGANIFEKASLKGTSTNAYGFSASHFLPVTISCDSAIWGTQQNLKKSI